MLAQRSHDGPLVVQKSLYPEGDAVCQNIVVHPPGGIVGGDRLSIAATLGANSRAQLTTPGAAKWYRSAGARAAQCAKWTVADAAVLEWFPLEAIVFDGAIADLETTIALSGGAAFIGWDVICLGRAAAGERFTHGCLRQRVELRRDGALVFVERALLEGGARFLDSPVGLNGAPVWGTLLAAAPKIPDHLLAACRGVSRDGADVSVTQLPGLLIARYRGASPEAARAYFVELWRLVRPALVGRDAVPPRIWNT